MRIVSLLSVLVLFSGCVSFHTGLQLAQFGVNVGFDIHNYVDEKKQEAKEIVDANQSR